MLHISSLRILSRTNLYTKHKRKEEENATKKLCNLYASLPYNALCLYDKNVRISDIVYNRHLICYERFACSVHFLFIW